MSFIVHIFLCAFGIICNQYNLANAEAVHGYNIRRAQENEFPFVVAIIRLDDENNLYFRKICTGSLVTRKDVLTAEHCLYEETVSQVQIVVGSINVLDGRRYNLCWWLTYDQWMVSMGSEIEFPRNDVAMIRLLSTVANQNPAPLLSVSHENLIGLEATIATWSTKVNVTHMEYVKETVDVSILSNNECSERCSRICGQNVVIPQRVLCSFKQPFVLLSPGDSGGPLLFEGHIVAINNGVCPPSVPDQFFSQKVNVHFGIKFYNDFIFDVMYNC